MKIKYLLIVIAFFLMGCKGDITISSGDQKASVINQPEKYMIIDYIRLTCIDGVEYLVTNGGVSGLTPHLTRENKIILCSDENSQTPTAKNYFE